MGKERVVAVFVSLVALGVLLALAQISYFGFKGVTCLSVLDSDEINFEEGDFQGIEFSDGKLYLSSEVSSGEYTSRIIDLGDQALVKRFDWQGESSGKLFYMKDETGKFVISYDEGVSWQELKDSKKIDEIANARTKSALVEETPGNIEFQIMVCDYEDCSDREFVEANLEDLNMEGRYFQFKIIFNGQGSYVESFQLDYELLKAQSDNLHIEDSKESESNSLNIGGNLSE